MSGAEVLTRLRGRDADLCHTNPVYLSGVLLAIVCLRGVELTTLRLCPGQEHTFLPYLLLG